MVVAAVLGILASVALPKFGNMILKAREALVKGKLGGLRSAIAIYYADTEGQYPGKGHPYNDPYFIWFSKTLDPKYMSQDLGISIPATNHFMINGVPKDIRHQGDTNNWAGISEADITSEVGGVFMVGFTPGYVLNGLYYPRWRYNTTTGHVRVNCYHHDSQRRVWSLY